MKRTIGIFLTALFIMFSFTGCTAVGEKSASLLTVYIATAVISLLTTAVYFCLVHKKDIWFILLLASVFVVNSGYLALAVSKNLEEALLANRISYLGSVFLPMSMLLIIIEACRINYRKWFPAFLAVTGIAVFLIAASPGYLDIYYKEMSLEFINGVTVINKVYGPWHIVYLFYLLIYFASMIICIIYASAKKKIPSNKHAIVLALSVLVNIGVWFIEQLVKIDFEFLSVSYIISELFLIGLYLMLQESPVTEKKEIATEVITETAGPEVQTETEAPVSDKTDTSENKENDFTAQYEYFLSQIQSLTPTERTIYDFYLSGKTTKEIMATLNIKENTLKYHNKNIYGKLGVSSRKQLLEFARDIKSNE